MPQAKMKARPMPPHIAVKHLADSQSTGELESLSLPKRNVVAESGREPAKLKAKNTPSQK